jgi:protease YdgD
MMGKFIFSLAGILILSGLPAQAQLLPPILSSIFGPDNRILADVRVYPYNAIVSVRTIKQDGLSYTCTGAWVGPRLVLTAAHCLEGHDPQTSVRVRTADGRGDVLARGPFVSTYGQVPIQRIGHDSHDWVLIELPRALGQAGWLEVDEEFSVGPRFVEPVRLAGYSSDRSGLTVHENCLVMQARRDGTMGHDCDMTRGASGAPILHCREDGKCFVVGVNITEVRTDSDNFHQGRYSHGVANRAVQARMFADTWNEMLQAQLQR